MASNLFPPEASECFMRGGIRVEETFQEKTSDKNAYSPRSQRTCLSVKSQLLDEAKQEERENMEYSVSITRNILPYNKKKEAKFLLFQYQSWHPVLCPMAFIFLLSLCCPLSVSHTLVFNLAPRVCLILSPRGKLRTLIENSHLMSASCLCLLLGKEVFSERFQHTKAARTAQTPHTHKAESL